MVEIRIKLTLDKGRYTYVKDQICEALAGNRAFVENDIIVSDVYQENNELCIVLGDESNARTVRVDAGITGIGSYTRMPNDITVGIEA